MLVTKDKIIRAKAQHLVYRFWMSALVPLRDFDDAKRCAVIAVEEMYHDRDKLQLIDAILEL